MLNFDKPLVLFGFDFGMRRIGVAIGQSVTKTANPLIILKAKDGVPSWDEIDKLIKTWKVDACVVGIPVHMDGKEQEITFAARRFAAKLKAQSHLPVFVVDERLTSIEAKRQMKENNVNRQKRQEIDSYAAKLILEAWLGSVNK